MLTQNQSGTGFGRLKSVARNIAAAARLSDRKLLRAMSGPHSLGAFFCMALPYRPQTGELLICAFDDAAIGAEMIKKRPVVVVSCSSSHHRKLCTVVPISTTAPAPAEPWHHCLPHLTILGWKANATMWAKCDMLETVSFERLGQPYIKSRHGGRRYQQHSLPLNDLAALRACLRVYLGL